MPPFPPPPHIIAEVQSGPSTKMRAAPRDKWYILVLSYIIMLLLTLFAAGLIFAIYCCCNAALRLVTQLASPPPPRPFPAVENQVAQQACDLFAQWGQAAHVDPADTSLYDILGIHWPCGGDGNDYAALVGQARDAYMNTADSFTPNVLVTNAGTLKPESHDPLLACDAVVINPATDAEHQKRYLVSRAAAMVLEEQLWREYDSLFGRDKCDARGRDVKRSTGDNRRVRSVCDKYWKQGS